MRFPEKHRWLLTGVAVPFLATRAALLIVGWFSTYFPICTTYANAAVYERGYAFTWWHRLLDIWGRWDSHWYLSIVRHGYRLEGVDAAAAQSNVVFFPLFPGLVKLVMKIIPCDIYNDAHILLVGVILSNLLLIGALVLLYRIALRVFEDARTAEMSIWFLLLSPGAFFLSAFYTESTFLFFSLAAILAAMHRRWALACIFGMILSAARPLGVGIGLPILLLYLNSIRWRLRDIRPSILWLGIIPLGLVAFFTYMHIRFGDFWAPIRGQAAWDHEPLAPWNAFFDPTVCWSVKISADRAVCLAALLLALSSLFTLRPRALGIYALALLLVPLSGGTLDGASRYCLVIFPLFLQLALLARERPWLDHSCRILMFTLQVLFFTAWCLFYRMI